MPHALHLYSVAFNAAARSLERIHNSLSAARILLRGVLDFFLPMLFPLGVLQALEVEDEFVHRRSRYVETIPT